MNTRIVTKVGFIYRTKETSKGHRYLQLVAIDQANMNSDVIAVFSAASELKGENYDELVKSPLEFYMHTTVSQGVRDGLWEKVGKAPVNVDLSAFTFKYYRDQEHVDMGKELAKETGSSVFYPPFSKPYWDVWCLLDSDFHYLNGPEGQELKAEEGGIFPASDVIYRIENGVSSFKSSWPTTPLK